MSTNSLTGAPAAALLSVCILLAAGPARAQESSPVAVVTLEEAIELSLERDPDAVAAQAAVSTAGAGLLQARGAWLPDLTANGVYANSSNRRFDQTTGQLVSESYTGQLQASYEIFSGGRRLAQQRSAGAALDAADAGLRAQRFTTVLQTTEAFYAAAAAADLARVAGQRLQRATQQLEFAQARLELGTATRSDVLRAELEVGNADLAVVDADAALRTTALSLGRQVGIAGEVRTADAALPAEAPPLPPVEELVATALRQAPGVTAAEATLRSRRADKLAAYTPYLPSVRIAGGYDWFAFQFPPDEQSWSMRLFASLPLFNGFDREAAVQRAAAAERTAAARARDATIGARVEVETAVREIAAAERRVEISDRAVELAREDLRVQEERYRLGIATILELQASQVTLADSEVAAVRARQALGSAVARLEAILGGPIGQER